MVILLMLRSHLPQLPRLNVQVMVNDLEQFHVLHRWCQLGSGDKGRNMEEGKRRERKRGRVSNCSSGEKGRNVEEEKRREGIEEELVGYVGSGVIGIDRRLCRWFPGFLCL